LAGIAAGPDGGAVLEWADRDAALAVAYADALIAALNQEAV
jgi:hypothetical protein